MNRNTLISPPPEVPVEALYETFLPGNLSYCCYLPCQRFEKREAGWRAHRGTRAYEGD
jgi:hypothetical protein